MTDGSDQWRDAFPGQEIGAYRIGSFLGGGAFSYVYEAVHVPTGDAVAIKILHPNARQVAVSEFDTESSMLQVLERASCVVTMREAGQDMTNVTLAAGFTLPLRIRFMALELASACMDELLTQRELLSWLERLRLWRGVVLGTHQMHMKRMVHRDIKASNCLLFVGVGDRTTAKVADLGRGKRLDSIQRFDDDMYSVGRGDPRFAAPEFIWLQGQADESAHLAADLYGLGSVLFELATGIGLTQVAVGPGLQLMEENMRSQLVNEAMDLSVLVSSFSTAFDLFGSEVPRVIRHEARLLISQLCDPRPVHRWPQKLGRKMPADHGLHWLLTRADILIKRVEAEAKMAARANRRGSAA